MFDELRLYDNPSKNVSFTQHYWETTTSFFRHSTTSSCMCQLVKFFICSIQHCFPALSLLANGTLIALILKSKGGLGAYRYLLLTFAIVDVYYGLVHFLILPVGHWSQNINALLVLVDTRSVGECVLYGGARVHKRLMKFNYWNKANKYVLGKLAVCFYATAHSHSYVVLVFHFLYRLLVMKG